MFYFFFIGIFLFGFYLQYPQQMTAIFSLAGIALTFLIFYPSLIHKYREASKRRAENDRREKQAAENAIIDKRSRDEQEIEHQKLQHFKASLPTPAQFRERFSTVEPSSTFTVQCTIDPVFFAQYEQIYRTSQADLYNLDYLKTLTRPFLEILMTPLDFELPDAQRFAGTWIVAPPGRGKTNLLHNLIAEDLKKPCTIVLMDSKGDMINSYKGYGDVVIINPQTAQINPLQLGSSVRSVEFLEYIFSALLETGMTALQKTLFRSVLTLLLKVPGATLETFRQVLTNGIESYIEYLAECDPATYDFFTVGKPTEFNSPTYKETKQQILWRLRLILSNEYLREIFTAPTTNVPFNELLDSGKVIIIDNSKDDLGEDGAEFFGRFFVALVWMAAVSRSRLRPEQKVPVYFYIDECHTVIKRDTKITTILDECRSQKIALILAHQRVAQISPEVIDALNNCAIRLANSDDDAESLAKRFRVEAPALRLPVGQFSCFVRDKTPQAVTINVPLFDMSTFPPAHDQHHHDASSPRQHPANPEPRNNYVPVQPQPRIVPRDEVEDF